MPILPSQIVPRSQPLSLSPRAIKSAFQRHLDDGASLRPAGEAKDDPDIIWDYPPRYALDLFDTRFYLAEVRQNPAIRFFVAYVVQGEGRRATIHPRLFYKDISLVWRVASHMIATEDEFWIGKGDLVVEDIDGYDVEHSKESTTDLPIEIQDSLESLNRRAKKVREDQEALYLFLRNAPKGRVAPYRDFTEPRRRAAATPRNQINGGRSVAYFTRKNDPRSLKIAKGFEPDFAKGILETSTSKSVTYGGALTRYRILSRNRKIQYYFFAGDRHVWIVPPQATTTELSSYGVRTITVEADDDMFIPGFEYHWFGDDDPNEHFTQIPEGWAGEQSEHDESRADASPWLDELPVVREFRRKVLKK